MKSLLALAPHLLDVGERLRENTRRWKTFALLSLIAAVAMIFALIYFSAAFYLYLAQTNPPWQAALITGLIALAVAVLLALTGYAVSARRRRKLERRRLYVPTEAASMSAGVQDALGRLNVRTSDAVITGLVAGLVLGASPGLRRKLFGGDPRADRSKDRRVEPTSDRSP